MGQRIFNTLKKAKEDFVPLEDGKVSMYVCGVTPYDLSHIGHARVYVAFDVVYRWLKTKFDVTYVRNYTDVDDKIIARATERDMEPLALSAKYIAEYQHDMNALKVSVPDVEPKVSTHIDDIVEFVDDLVKKDVAYRVPSETGVEGAGDDVYYRVKSFDGYTKLSGRDLDDMISGARVEVDSRKESPLDFALWKSAKPGEISWDSPFGKGRPGWHIECSAMSSRYLGATFDIHGGGRDLIFPHHTNEIAQSEARSGCEYVRTWMHNGFVDFDGEKMSKSLGNFFTIREVTERNHPEALRYFLLTATYRSPINFDVEVTCPSCGASMSKAAQEALKCESCGAEATQQALRDRVTFPCLEEAERNVQYIYETRRDVDRYLEQNAAADAGDDLETTFSASGQQFAPWRDFGAYLDDDFCTSGALACVYEMTKVANLLIRGQEKEVLGRKLKPPMRAKLLTEWKERLTPMTDILGIGDRDPAPFLLEHRALRAAQKGIDPAEVEDLIRQRVAARADKDFAKADEVRERLTALGVEVRDGTASTEWSVQ